MFASKAKAYPTPGYNISTKFKREMAWIPSVLPSGGLQQQQIKFLKG